MARSPAPLTPGFPDFLCEGSARPAPRKEGVGVCAAGVHARARVCYRVAGATLLSRRLPVTAVCLGCLNLRPPLRPTWGLLTLHWALASLQSLELPRHC